MSRASNFLGSLSLPLIAAPMFLASGPDLVVECCRAGVVGTFPALNQRTTEGFERWIEEIKTRLQGAGAVTPFGVNLIVHKSNRRVQADLEVVVRQAVPLVITSLGAVPELVEAVHGYGGLVFHDVVNRRHGEKAAAAGVDGLIAVAAGAGGHAGAMSPFALLAELRQVFDGVVVLAGGLSTGRDIAATRIMGADLAYMGTRFLATRESLADERHKEMIIGAMASDIVYTPDVSGVPANFLRQSLIRAGLDPDHLQPRSEFEARDGTKVWKDIWSAGQGVSSIEDIPAVADLCESLRKSYLNICQSGVLLPPGTKNSRRHDTMSIPTG